MVFAIIGLIELCCDEFLSPKLAAGSPWIVAKVSIPFGKVPVDSSHRLTDRLIVAIVDDSRSHAAENRLDHIQELSVGRQWSQLDVGTTAMCPILRRINLVHSPVKLLRCVPRGGVPREVKT